ncbi:terminal uridylyltransferase 4-like isoform X2 [Varroa destructor]|nr:terminal uridylyltransferase 4-like isoform X2 [Varroa destructor]XP_022650339.1 terminal uridylyltransferase 4-like isoform X2 [Varroa destructor]XP_022650340.1 terminal uridylyltransferase 4-like isoform X2 [Varroa destructor]XP_022650341.1 terminal uridylyltransferase 4-like isoform X2 [Varroa destructor]XP_022650342.1 terminal uridylyltransferase 4-like isoform X2 [Varroa destructor]XP_022650343.1 terminal uridylyltransferase 4-like isoform X2 [Varroa destructor]
MDSPGRHHDKGHRPYHNSPRGLQSMRTPERGPRIGLQGTGSQNSYDIFGLHGGGSRPVSGPYSPHTRHQPSQGPHGSIGPVDHSPGPSKRSIRPPPQRDSFRDHQHRTRDETDALLNEHRIVNLDRPSPMFPNAKWFCRLCHQHFNQVNTGVEHTSTSIHKKKKAALDLRKVVLALPRKPEPRHATALDTELRRVFGKYRMTAENLDKRRELVAELDKYLTESMQNSRLQNIVDKRWLKLKLNLQGSSLNGMGLATSDVNVDLHLPKAAPTDVQAKVFFEILHLLERWSSLQKVEPHFNQKVPKIKGVHCATNLALELGLGGTPALKTNRLLSDYASLDERVLPLAVCLRYWASKCRLDDPMFGTLPPHSFPIMTIYYLQQCSPPVLPCIHDALVTASAAAAAVSKAATAAAVTANNNSSSSNSNSNNNSSSNSNSNNTSSTTSTQNPVPIPSVPVFTEADGSGGVSSDQGEEDENDYVTPTKLADWKSENTASLAELWVGMLRFYSAEFKMRKVCVSLLTRKKVLLTARRWPSRYIGIEDPFCRKKSLSRSMINDQIMTYFLMCLRSSALYFNVPRTSSLATVYDPVSTLNIGIVEDPDGDDIEDGLAADEEADEDDDDQEKDNAGQESAASTSGSGAATVDVEDKDSKEGAPLENLAGWDQQLPQSIIESIANCDRLNYCMESVNTLTGGMTLPKACIVCRQPGHRGDTCTETQLPRPMNASPKAFEDADGLHTALCKYIHVNFRPAVSELELEKRVETVKAIEEFIQKTIPESYLTLFGSSRNGFSLEKADLDICLKYRGKEGIDEQMDVRDIIFRVATILDNHPQISDVQPIASAKVPIVKFHHDAFGVDGDISLYNVLAEHNTAMLHAYSCIDERVVPLGAALKQLVKLCDMGDASRGSLSSYAYVIMLIHYLQQEGIVPVLQKLPPIGHPKGKPLPTRMVDGWNAYYFDDMERLDEVWPSRGQNKKAIGQLWLGLIDYYSTKFKFDLNVVCIRQMEPLSRLEKMWTSKEINIEDPFELDHNLGTGVSSKMSKYIQSALITSRNWFLTSPGRPLSTTEGDLVDLYRHFMNPRELTVGRPPKDRGCKRCGKIGHWIKDCPIKANGESNGERRPDRRMCHHCGEIGHLIKDCGKRLQQIRQQRNAILPPLSMRNQHDMPRYSVPRSVDIRNEERHMHRESGSPERLAPGRRHHYHQQQAPPTPYAHDSAITAVAAAAGVTRISPRCLTTTTTVDGQGFDTVSSPARPPSLLSALSSTTSTTSVMSGIVSDGLSVGSRSGDEEYVPDESMRRLLHNLELSFQAVSQAQKASSQKDSGYMPGLFGVSRSPTIESTCLGGSLGSGLLSPYGSLPYHSVDSNMGNSSYAMMQRQTPGYGTHIQGGGSTQSQHQQHSHAQPQSYQQHQPNSLYDFFHNQSSAMPQQTVGPATHSISSVPSPHSMYENVPPQNASPSHHYTQQQEQKQPQLQQQQNRYPTSPPGIDQRWGGYYMGMAGDSVWSPPVCGPPTPSTHHVTSPPPGFVNGRDTPHFEDVLNQQQQYLAHLNLDRPTAALWPSGQSAWGTSDSYYDDHS